MQQLRQLTVSEYYLVYLITLLKVVLILLSKGFKLISGLLSKSISKGMYSLLTNFLSLFFFNNNRGGFNLYRKFRQISNKPVTSVYLNLVTL